VARIPPHGVSPQELSRRATASSSLNRFAELAAYEKTLFIITVFFFFSIVVTTLLVMTMHGHGNKKLVRSLFLGAILLLMLIVGLGMIMVRRNLGEVLFSMTLVLVLGIFVGGGGYLDVIGYGMDV
jgi:phosphatidylglycerophosphate synthase